VKQWLAAVCTVTFMACPRFAAAQPSEVSQACITAYERAGERRQIFRDWVGAKAESAKCATECPAELADTCKQWLAEDSSKIALLEVEARDVTRDKITLRIDGDVRAESSLELNPGDHELRWSAEGFIPRTMKLTLAEGERERLVLTLTPAPALLPPQAPPKRPPQAAPAPPIAGWTVLSLGLASLTAGGALTIAGHVRAGALEESCAPFCSDEEVAVVEREWVAAGICAAAGLAASTAGLVLVLLPPDDQAAVPTVSFDGTTLSVGIAF
jgi:hypothetical protein